MSYPPPPGLPAKPPQPGPASSSSSGASASSAPAPRPGFKAAFGTVSAAPTYTASAQPTYSAPSYGASSYPSYSQPPGGVSSQGQQSYGAQSYGAEYNTPPQIRNPFPLPGASDGSAGAGVGVVSDFDPEMAAQIAQWQSTYASRDAAPTTGKDGRPDAASGQYQAQQQAAEAAAAAASNGRKKTVVREGGGKKWSDDTLLEWDPSHLRLFVGNLAGETTDDSLLKAFSRWRSVQKARVIRDKRTTKSKGYGFVSFSDADDFFQAAKEMQGKYIQSHPVTIKKANTEINPQNVKEKGHDRRKNYKGNRGNNNRNGNGGGYGEDGYSPRMGPAAGSGVTKPGQKTKNGLRLLG